MTVTALLPAYPPHSRVGAWLASHRFLSHLAARGHDVSVVPWSGDHMESYRLDGVHVARSCEAACVYAKRADVVISHVGDGGRSARLASEANVPNVRMAHGLIWEPSLLDGAALVVFNSEALRASVNCPAPSIVCHPPVDLDHFRTTPGEHVTLVNLSEQKGGELFWRLVRCAPHRSFLGVKGHYGPQYVDNFPNATVIENTVNMRDDVYARTRILLMPSERETWGMTAIEAAASGVPTIAHPTPGLVESLGAAGIFVDREDGHGWLDEIERLHDPDEWAAASALALARAAELDPLEDLNRFATAVEQLHCTGART